MLPVRRPSQRGPPANRHQVICFDALTVQFKESPKHHIQTTVFDNSKASRREKDRIVIKDDLGSKKNCLNRDITLPHSYILPRGGKLFFRVQTRKYLIKWETLMEAEINFDAIKHVLENPQDQGASIRNDGFLLTGRNRFPKIYANFRLGSYLLDGLSALEIRRCDIQGKMSKCHQFLSALAEQKRDLSDIQLLLRALVHPFSQMTDGLQYQHAAHHEILELAENMTMVAGCILDCEQFASLSQLRSAIIQAQRLCQDITNFLLRLIRIGDLQQILDAVIDDHNRGEIDRLRKRFAQFMARFDRGVDVLSTLTEPGAVINLNARQMADQYNNMLQRIGSILDHDLLRKLLLSGVDYRIPSDCMSGPLESLSDVMSWIDNPEASSNVMFLSDAKVSGSQSTVIASTLVQGYSANQRLGSFFFFDKDKPKNTTSACVRRIAYDLAEQHPVVRAEILRKLKEHPRFLDTSDTSRLFTELIRNPMLKVDGKAMPSSRRPLIILGGVDECGSQREKDANAYTLLRVIQSWPELPSFCKLVLSSPITPATPKSKSKGEKLPPPVTAKVQQQNPEWRPAKFEDERRRMAHFFVDGDDTDAPLDPGLQFDAGLVQVDGEKAPEDQMVPLASEEPPAPPPPVESSAPSLQVPGGDPAPGIEDHSPAHGSTAPAVIADLPSPSSHQASQSNGLDHSSALSHPVQDEGNVNSTSTTIATPVPETTIIPVPTQNTPDEVPAPPPQGMEDKVNTFTSEPQAPAPEIVVTADTDQHKPESGPGVPHESTASQKASIHVATPAEEVAPNQVIAPALSRRKSSQKTVHFSDGEDDDEVIKDCYHYPPEHEITVADHSPIEDPPKSSQPEEIPLPMARDDELEPEKTMPEEPVPESFVAQDIEATTMPSQPLSFNVTNPSPSEPASHEIAVPQTDKLLNEQEQNEDAGALLHEAETSADMADISLSIPDTFSQEASPATIDDLIAHPPDLLVEAASTPASEPHGQPVLIAHEPEQSQQALSVQSMNAPIDPAPIIPTERVSEAPPVNPIPRSGNISALTPEPEQEVRPLPLIVEPAITEPLEQTPPASQTGQSTTPGMSVANPGPADNDSIARPTPPNIPSQPPRYSTVGPPLNAIPAPQEQTQPASNTTSTNLSLSLSTATNGAAPASSTTVIVIMTGNTTPNSLRSLFGAPSPVPQTPSVPTAKNVTNPSEYAPSLPPPPEPFRPSETRMQDVLTQSQPDSAARVINPEQQVRDLPAATVSAPPEAAAEPIPTAPSPDSRKGLVSNNDNSDDHAVTAEHQGNWHKTPEQQVRDLPAATVSASEAAAEPIPPAPSSDSGKDLVFANGSSSEHAVTAELQESRHNAPEQQVRDLPATTVSAPEAAAEPIPPAPSSDSGKDLVFANGSSSEHAVTAELQESRHNAPEQQVRDLPATTVSAPEAAAEPIPPAPSSDSGKDLVFANDNSSHHVATAEPQENWHNAPQPSLSTPSTVSDTADAIIVDDNKSNNHHDEHHLIESSDGSDGEESAEEQEDEPTGNPPAAHRDEDILRLVERQDGDCHEKEAHDDNVHLVESSDESESEVTEADHELPGEVGTAEENVKAEVDTLFLNTQVKPEESGGDENEVTKMDDAPEEDIIKLGQVEEKDVIIIATPKDAAVVGESAIVEIPCDMAIMQDVQPVDITKSANGEESVVLADEPSETAIGKDVIILDTPSEIIVARDTDQEHETKTVEAEEKGVVIMDVAKNTLPEHSAPVEMAVSQDAQPLLEDRIPTEGSSIVLNDSPSIDETVIAAADVSRDNIVLADDALAHNIPSKETIILAATKPEVIVAADADKSIDIKTTPDAPAGSTTEASTATTEGEPKKTELWDDAGHATGASPDDLGSSGEEPCIVMPTQKDREVPSPNSVATTTSDKNKGSKLEPPSAPEPENKAESAITKPGKSIEPAVSDVEEGDEELPAYSAEPSDDQAVEQSTAVSINITNNNTIDGDADNETETAVSLSFSSKTRSRSAAGNSMKSMMNISINSNTSRRMRRPRKN